MVNGVLLIDKPAGLTSRQVDNAVRKRVGRKVRVGHAGTLDPFATGVLPVLVGEATKLSPYLTGCEKRYQARVLLGTRTDTADCDGQPTEEAPVPLVTAVEIRAAMEALTGDIRQQVPAYSAVRVNGERLYEQARRGDANLVLPVRDVKVTEWALEGSDAERIGFSVTCSAGTYVRVLGEQLAALLGTLGHLDSLRRLRSGKLHVENAIPLEQALDELDLTPLEAVLELPVLPLDAREVRLVSHGRLIEAAPGTRAGDIVQAQDEEGRLLAILERRSCEAGQEAAWRVLRGFGQSP